MKPEPWYNIPNLNITEKHAIIIGGGLAGTSAAYSLVRKGWKVTLIERERELATGASGNLAGIIAPMITHNNDPIGKFYLRGFEYSLAHLQELENHISFNNCGVIELGTGKANKDLSNIIIPSADITKLSQEEASHLAGIKLQTNGLHIAKAGLVNPADLCRANILTCGNNIKVIFSKDILSLEKDEYIWSAIDGFGNKIASAPVVIIANAADAMHISQASWVPLHKVRGQLTHLPSTALNLKTILCYDGGYISPEVNGFNYIGATYSRDNLNADVTIEDHIENITNLKKVIDIGDINYEELSGRVSFRASVPDRRPVIGAVPDIDAFYYDYADLKHGRNKKYPDGKYLQGLYISTGHGSRGLTSCPIGGELLASMINNEELPVPAGINNILSPARFVIKNLKGRK